VLLVCVFTNKVLLIFCFVQSKKQEPRFSIKWSTTANESRLSGWMPRRSVLRQNTRLPVYLRVRA
jgi:hypothetical protein